MVRAGWRLVGAAVFVALALGAWPTRVEAGAPYASLGDATTELPLSALVRNRMLKHGGETVGEVRAKLGRAILVGSFPFGAGLARALRRQIGDWDLPDSIAILTREELRLAHALDQARLKARAWNILADADVRTFADLRRVVAALPEVASSADALAHRQLREVLACEGRLDESGPNEAAAAAVAE